MEGWRKIVAWNISGGKGTSAWVQTGNEVVGKVCRRSTDGKKKVGVSWEGRVRSTSYKIHLVPGLANSSLRKEKSLWAIEEDTHRGRAVPIFRS